VDELTRFYQLCDPLRPLEAEETDLYVDWQNEIGPEDIKTRLANSIAFSVGIEALRRIVELRARKADLELAQVFEPPESLDRFVRLSGGRLRSLLVLLHAALERTDRLPIGSRLTDLTIWRVVDDLALPLRRREWQALRLYRRLGEAATLLAEGRLARAVGKLDRARAAYREAERIYRAIGLKQDAERAAAEAKELPA